MLFARSTANAAPPGHPASIARWRRRAKRYFLDFSHALIKLCVGRLQTPIRAQCAFSGRRGQKAEAAKALEVAGAKSAAAAEELLDELEEKEQEQAGTKAGKTKQGKVKKGKGKR